MASPILGMKKSSSLLVFILFLGLSLQSLAGEVYHYHPDNFGTPMAMTDQSGKVVWRSDELPFGEEYQTEELPQHNNRRFLGKELDKVTGLVYMGARYLDPKTGRFTQQDPVGLVDPFNHGKINQAMLENPQRQNRYVYGLNNPYRYVDPDGRDPKDPRTGETNEATRCYVETHNDPAKELIRVSM